MNIGDKVRKMTNEEMAWFIRNELRGTHADILEKINSEVETTGHEDLVNAGWEIEFDDSGVRYAKSMDGGTKFVWLFANVTEYYTNCTDTTFTDTEIDFLRKCADKIRKERGWA